MPIDITALPSFWRRAVVTTTPVEWELPEDPLLVVYDDGCVAVRARPISRGTGSLVAYHVITNGAVGPRIERPAPVVTRVWSEVPPNDTRVQVLYNDGSIRQYTDTVFVVDIRRAVAWCLNTDLLTAPPPTVVTPDMVRKTGACSCSLAPSYIAGSLTRQLAGGAA